MAFSFFWSFRRFFSSFSRFPADSGLVFVSATTISFTGGVQARTPEAPRLLELYSCRPSTAV